MALSHETPSFTIIYNIITIRAGRILWITFTVGLSPNIHIAFTAVIAESRGAVIKLTLIPSAITRYKSDENELDENDPFLTQH